ncbi:uncharacterized protein VcgC/VcgE DUF2780 [Vibrio sp. ES.051]|uniref:DUF2780 domain-containing protein n=1 Tax=Vibrio sp. ES.051 TaxID=1761909 RepID=UPI000BF506F9|nr:DUF2780 domain-containing protein [Vibrio sp. ES.051]PFG45386.1 uncharacterized protein VcgC/VcgE DUF2780 [Vibrio sp. ES.051]
MGKTLLTLALLLINISNAHAFLDIVTEKSEKNGLMDMVNNSLNAEPSPLTDMLTSQLPISAEQAIGGSSALLALTQNQLSQENSTELKTLLPGLANLQGAQSRLGNIDNIEAVNRAFDSLGLDPSMISQFGPIILNYLNTQGASEALLSALGGLWENG